MLTHKITHHIHSAYLHSLIVEFDPFTFKVNADKEALTLTFFCLLYVSLLVCSSFSILLSPFMFYFLVKHLNSHSLLHKFFVFSLWIPYGSQFTFQDYNTLI
jgi:hypothetical protein